MRNYRLLILFIIPAFAACRQPKKKMEEKTVFPYSMSITAPAEYPVEVHLGYFSNAKGFITPIPKVGIEASGWIKTGSDGGLYAGIIPAHLNLTWISFAEKKFWEVDVDLPADKMLALFRKGYTDLDGIGNYTHQTYDHIAIGLAPGGVVVLWLQGRFFSTEIGRYQAKDTFVKKDDFRPVPFPDETQEEFYDVFFKSNTTPEIRESLKKNGFPYGLWDKYRIKYKWRLRPQFYRPGDKQKLRYDTFVNGEKEGIYEKELLENPYHERAVPLLMSMYFADGKALTFKDVNASVKVEFDEKEIMSAFEELAKEDKNIQIELMAKVKFQYEGLTFSVVAGKKEIPLLKTITKTHHLK